MDKEKLQQYKQKSLDSINDYLCSLIESDEERTQKKASLLSYWFCDYIRFLEKEPTFDPSKNIRYNRGDIVKIHLGYNIGSEQGGLHYAVVIDNNNSKGSSTVTIVPLSSVREGRKIHHTSVEIGNEVFKCIMSKHDKLEHEIHAQLDDMVSRLQKIEKEDLHEPQQEKELIDLVERIEPLKKMDANLKSLKAEILKMKQGSVALVGQITTISKIRIYDPVYSNHVLYGIRLNPTTLSLINDKLKELYIFNK